MFEDRDHFDAIQDARSEIASETGDTPSTRQLVRASLDIETRCDTYYRLSDLARHPFGQPTASPTSPAGAMTLNGSAAPHLSEAADPARTHTLPHAA